MAAAAVIISDRERMAHEGEQYLRFLLMRWKLCAFVPALLFVSLAGQLTDDESWDLISGAGMSLLTYASAPWAVGAAFQVLAGRRRALHLLVAVCAILVSSSWFYDAYLLLRDGQYTPRWAGNLTLSPIIYLAAGLLWNLESAGPWCSRMSFVRADWPSPPKDARFWPIIPAAAPLVLIAAFVLVAFVGWRL